MAPIHQLHPTLPQTPRRPVSNIPAPSPPLYQPPIKQLQSTQILAPMPSISTLPEEDEPETEQHKPTPDQHEPEQEHQEPEPEQQSELLTNRVPPCRQNPRIRESFGMYGSTIKKNNK